MNLQEAAEKVKHLGEILNLVYYLDNDNTRVETHTFRGIRQKYINSGSKYIIEVIMEDYPNVITMPMEDVFATKEQAAEALNRIIVKKIEDLQSKIIPTVPTSTK